MTEDRFALHTRIQREQGLIIAHTATAAFPDPRLDLVCGSPATVASQTEAVE